MAQIVKNLPAMQETQGLTQRSERSSGEGNGNLPVASILAWRIPQTEEPGGL